MKYLLLIIFIIIGFYCMDDYDTAVKEEQYKKELIVENAKIMASSAFNVNINQFCHLTKNDITTG